jgi:hypothetical protein
LTGDGGLGIQELIKINTNNCAISVKSEKRNGTKGAEFSAPFFIWVSTWNNDLKENL